MDAGRSPGVAHPESFSSIQSRFKAVPMGWTHALWICQQCHEHIVNSIPKLPASLRLVDGKPAPHMRPFVHTEYVDNFVALSQSQGLVKELAAEVHGGFARAWASDARG